MGNFRLALWPQNEEPVAFCKAGENFFSPIIKTYQATPEERIKGIKALPGKRIYLLKGANILFIEGRNQSEMVSYIVY